MGAITIRNLDDEVIASLKAEAEQKGRSMEEEARVALAELYRPKFSVEEWFARKEEQFREWGWSEERRKELLASMLADLDDYKQNGPKPDDEL